MTDSTITEATPEQGQELFDRRARELLGISGREFLDAWDEGAFAGDDRLAVMKMAMLLPFGRE